MKLFGHNYSSVNTNENAQNFIENGTTTHQAGSAGQKEKFRKSLNANRSLNKGFSIVDVFFSKRKSERGPRWPKGSFLNFY